MLVKHLPLLAVSLGPALLATEFILEYILFDLWPIIAIVFVAIAYLITQFEAPPPQIQTKFHVGTQKGKQDRQYLSEYSLNALVAVDEIASYWRTWLNPSNGKPTNRKSKKKKGRQRKRKADADQ